MSTNEYYDPIVSCYYCGANVPESECSVVTVSNETGHSGASTTVHISKKSGLSGASVNMGRSYYRNEDVLVCQNCMHEKESSGMTFGGFQLAGAWLILVALVEWYFRLDYSNFVGTLVYLWIPVSLGVIGAINILKSNNKFVNKGPTEAVVGLAIILAAYNLFVWMRPEDPNPNAQKTRFWNVPTQEKIVTVDKVPIVEKQEPVAVKEDAPVVPTQEWLEWQAKVKALSEE